MTTYPVSQKSRTQKSVIDESNRCPSKVQTHQQTQALSTVRQLRSHAELLPRWLCPTCRGVSQPPVGAAINLDFDIETYITKCRGSIRILPKIPKRALILFADACEKTLREAIEQRTLEKWGRLLCFCIRQTPLTTKVKQQLTDFMELSGIPSSPPERQFTNNNIKIDGHHYRKRVEEKFADGDIR
ncbi:hypothetical protein GJ496_011012 [Pomphorhynchus laevis]|nr:hypothetical protein GJ496_011012 [Pomphorhynchus laevis]